MDSLRGRLALTIAGLALLAVVAVTVIVAMTTSDSMEETLDDQRAARNAIVAVLTEEAIELDRWSDALPLAEDLAAEHQARIVLADIDGRLLLDTGAGELPPLEGVIDPFGPLAEFGEEPPFDETVFDKTLFTCFEEEAIPYKVDEFGEVYIVDDDLGGVRDESIDACYEEALEVVEGEVEGIKEPALLFVGFSVAPSIPWLPIAAVAAVVIGAAAAAAAPLSGFVTRSLRSLAGAARSIREGDLDVRVDTTSPTEVADLAVSFNEMAEELSQAEIRRKQLTADVAHELRSPLTNILGHLDAIEDGVIEPTPEQVRIVSSEAVRLAHLVDDLQTLAALDEDTLTLTIELSDLNRVVGDAVEARRSRARDRRITLEQSGAAGLEVEMDRRRFDQIVGNLLDNALEHTPDGGTVTIATAAVDDGAAVTVADTGPGIDVDLLPYVFDRLSRADPSRSPGKGERGLGLSIARGLARAHGGDVVAENMAAGGARFKVTIPRHRPGHPVVEGAG